jgi:hypothetical protein
MKDKCSASQRSKWLLLSCALLFSSATALAQETNDPSKSNIEILKLHWEKQMRPPRNFDPSVVSTAGVFRDPSAMTPTSSAMDATRVTNSIQNPPPTAGSAFPATPGRLPIYYAYSMKIKNDGARMIEGVAWDYVFIDKSSNNELGRHQFLSYEKVAAGKTVTFKSELRSPPTRVVQASNSREKHPQFTERAVVQCVLYADDSSWRNHDAPVDVCSLLRKNKNLLKQNRGKTRS